MSLIVTGAIIAVNAPVYIFLLGVTFGVLGFFVLFLGVERPGVGFVKLILGDRWLVTFLSLLPAIVLFFQFDVTQGGPYGTLKFGGVVLEHEGFAIGMFGAATYFEPGRLKWVIIGVSIAFLVSEAYINSLVDFVNNPFGNTLSGLLGFLITYVFGRAAGLRERKETGTAGDFLGSVVN